jgi:peptidylprolyl isomerase
VKLASTGKPTIKVPKKTAPTQLVVQPLIKGTGSVVKAGQTISVQYTGVIWDTNKKFDSSWDRGQATDFPIGSGQVISGWDEGLVGQTVGSQVLLVVPPDKGYGAQGQAQAGIKGTDTLVFVVDMLKDFTATTDTPGHQVSAGKGLPTISDTTGAAPAIKVPSSSKPPANLVSKTLIKGTGPTVAQGDTVVVQYTGVNWRTGQVFDASWKHGTGGQPFGFTIGASPSQVILGWDKGLAGQTVGSRVLLVIPPTDGYGKQGSPQAGIKGTDTLVFVVDIIGTFNAHSAAS